MRSFLIFLVLSFAAAGLGSIFTNQSLKTWYPTIKKSSWNPPNWIFAPVWTMLYFTMAVAAWMVWQREAPQFLCLPMILFVIQLALNALWSVLCFGFRNPGLAFAEVLLLWFFILITTISFWYVDQLAGLLFIPYLLWVSFASFLNYTLWQLNKPSKSF